MVNLYSGYNILLYITNCRTKLAHNTTVHCLDITFRISIHIRTSEYFHKNNNNKSKKKDCD